MNLMGMGLAEIAVVMVVAFLVLGPNRAINLARTAGKLLGDLRRTFNDVANAMTLEEKGQAESRQAAPPQAGTQWESRPVAQEQPSQDEAALEESGVENSAPPISTEEELDGPSPAKNGDE